MSAFGKGLDKLRGPSVSRKQKGKLPLNVMADLLNGGGISHHRTMGTNAALHVSDLMKVDSQHKFCPREHVLAHFENKEHHIRHLTAAFELLFANGHSIHDHVRNTWIKRHRRGAQAWGIWECKCGELKIHGTKPADDPANVCTKCGTLADNYEEFHAYSKRYNLVGHPDFIIEWNGRLYIFEIKTIDRKDIEFDELEDPLGNHTLQGTFYYWLLRKMGYNVSPVIRYLYVDRSMTKLWSGKIYKEFPKKASGIDRLKPLLAKATLVKKSIKEGTLPARVCDSSTCGRAKNCKLVVSCFSRNSKNVKAPQAK